MDQAWRGRNGNGRKAGCHAPPEIGRCGRSTSVRSGGIRTRDIQLGHHVFQDEYVADLDVDTSTERLINAFAIRLLVPREALRRPGSPEAAPARIGPRRSRRRRQTGSGADQILPQAVPGSTPSLSSGSPVISAGPRLPQQRPVRHGRRCVGGATTATVLNWAISSAISNM